ncbi:MAG: TOMM precursor leader peptide-binding protein [Actinomycetota bacterium]|nr:TOMM precursor leader peptide-binding protein [Actinomycetota bacterium]
MGDEPSIPLLPLLKPWYRLLETADGIVLEHGRSTVGFGGAAATQLLPALLPLLDGERTVDEIVDVLGRPVESAVENALGLLARHALLTEGPPALPRSRVERTAIALAQMAPLSPSRIAGRLAETRVLVEGDAGLASATARLLRRSGVTVLRSGDEAATFVATAGRAGEPQLDLRNELALEHGTTWLPFGCFDGAAATIGPLVVPGETACYRCLVLRRDASSGCTSELVSLRAVPVRAPLAPTLVTLIASVATERILRWIGFGDPTIPGTVATLTTVPRLGLTDDVLLRAPRCPACSGIAASGLPVPWHEARWAQA